jgi:hypothetical protein
MVATEVAAVPPASDTSHSDDFRSVSWFGQRFTFTPNQAAIIEQLWRARELGNLDVGTDILIEAAECATKRVDVVFRKNKAWKTLVVPGERKRTYRLAEPSDRSACAS